jgi:hypothetical protein
MKVTRLGPTRPVLSATTLGGSGGTLGGGTPTPGGGQVPTASGSNTWAWGSNVASIRADGTLVLGPHVAFAEGSGIDFAVSSNTVTISSTGGGSDLGYFDVTDYGAVGDGTTDDTSSIQDAIDACHAAGGGTVFFPAGIYQLDGSLQDTSGHNAQLVIPQNDFDPGVGAMSIRFLGVGPTTPITDSHDVGSILRSSWDGSISGNPAIISTGPHDENIDGDFNWMFLSFEFIEIRAHLDPKLSAIDATSAVSLHWDHLTIGVEYGASPSFNLPTNANAVAVDMPWGALSQPGDGGHDLHIDGFYIGIRPSEQTVADIISVSRAAQGVVFRGSHDSPVYLRHATIIDRLEIFYCPRGIVFATDERWVHIGLACFEHDNSPFEVVYDIDDGSAYGYGFIGWHTADFDTGVEDNLVVNGATNLSLHGGYAKRWKLTNVVDVPTGTDPSTNPSNGRRLYAASATGNLTGRKSDGSLNDYETEWGGVAISGTPSAGQVPTATSGTAATWQTPSASGGGVGPILLESGHAVPFTFDEILQTSDGTDFLYASE